MIYYISMKSVRDSGKQYLEALKSRARRSRTYTSYQALGLDIAAILNDWDHKTLYIKLAKDGDPHRLLEVAKSVAERKDIANKGAYFMRVLSEEGLFTLTTKTKPKQKKHWPKIPLPF